MHLSSLAIVLLVTTWLYLLSSCFIMTDQTAAGSTDVEKQPNTTILPNSPRFVVKLPDSSLLCFSIEGYELFTYNLITSNYLVLNAFLNVTSIHTSSDAPPYTQIRGFGDVGVIIKSVDNRVRGGKRFFKHLINGEKKKAFMDGFGEVDLYKGAITFTLSNGHSNIESQQSMHEKFGVILDKPKCNVMLISSNGHTFNAYVQDGSGLLGVDTHGIIGQFFHPKVRVRENSKELHLAGRVVSVEKGDVWDTVMDEGYAGKTCWYPLEGEKVIEGHSWDYVVEHLTDTHYKYSLFNKYKT